LVGAFPADFPSDVRRPERPLRALAGFFRDSRRIFADPEARGSLLALSTFQGVVTAGSGAIFTLALDNDASGHAAAMHSLILVCVGVAAGCGLASIQTNPRRSLGLVPMGVTGLLFADVWAALASVDGIAPSTPSFLLGVMGGLVLVPLRTTYLVAVPADARGNAMSVMNTVISMMTALIALLMLALAQADILAGAQAQLWFVVALVAGGALLAWWLLLPQALEQFVEWVIWPMYRIRTHGPGADQLPERGPLLLIANHSSYFDPFWIAKILPRKLTPMMTSDFYDLPGIRWVMSRVVRAIRVERKRFRREAPELREAINVLRGGGCVCLFPESFLRRTEEMLLRQFGQGVWHILRALPDTPVVVFWIEGGWGSYASYKGGKPMKGKRLDWWRHIDIAVTEPQVLDAEVLADHRTTRRYLMRRCLEARRFLGLDVPEDSTAEEPTEADEEERVQ
jgi:1-acyl-sn-glycerol-3-phosphate acyltransferase